MAEHYPSENPFLASSKSGGESLFESGYRPAKPVAKPAAKAKAPQREQSYDELREQLLGKRGGSRLLENVDPLVVTAKPMGAKQGAAASSETPDIGKAVEALVGVAMKTDLTDEEIVGVLRKILKARRAITGKQAPAVTESYSELAKRAGGNPFLISLRESCEPAPALPPSKAPAASAVRNAADRAEASPGRRVTLTNFQTFE